MKSELSSKNSLVGIIRKLAKDRKWQKIFSFFKEGNFDLFRNKSEFTYYQNLFIDYLGFYSDLLMDIHFEDVDKEILDDFIYEDAYFLYKERKKKKKKSDANKNKEKIKHGKNKKDKNKPIRTFSWVFKNKKKAGQ